MRGRLAASLAASVLCGEALAQAAGPDGAALFETHCAACHNAGGTGTPGLAPPLDRPDFWQALGDDAPEFVSGVITKGLNMQISVRGQQYAGMMMPPVAGASDEELAAIASWILDALGETGQRVSAEDIAAARDGLTNDALKAMRPPTE